MESLLHVQYIYQGKLQRLLKTMQCIQISTPQVKNTYAKQDEEYAHALHNAVCR